MVFWNLVLASPRVWILSAVLAGLAGCAAESVAPPSTENPEAALPPRSTSETWDVIHMSGSRVGHIHTRTRSIEDQGEQRLEIEVDQVMSVSRFGDRSQPGIYLKSVETPTGEVVRFESRQQLGPQPELTSGRVVGEEMVMETTTTGKTVESRIAWSAETGGFLAVEQSLSRQPMKPGEKRALRGLAPLLNQVVQYDLKARPKQRVTMFDGSLDLMPIDVVTILPDGRKLRSTLWTDERGEPLKTHTPELNQETFRVTREVALDTSKQGDFDLGETTIIKLDKPLREAHRTQRVRYRVSLEPGSDPDESDPAKIFASSPTQQLRAIDRHTAEVTVQSLRGQTSVAAPAPADRPPTPRDREANNMIQSDHPLIVKMADEAAGEETDPYPLAAALERYVKANIEEINFSQALATAADVAQLRRGDCTEHAVLLAALARAKKIPARVAIGLVYVDVYQGFGYHMWTEMYINDRWIPFDATLGQGGIGGGHIKLSHSDLAGGDAYASFLPVARVMGRLKIEVLEAQ